MVRAFLAIDLPEDIKKRLSELSKMEIPKSLQLKWVEEKNFHITLHFFGNITEKILEKIIQAFKEAFKEYTSFHLELTEISSFPEKGKPRVIWIGVRDSSETLKKLHYSLKKVLKKLKLEENKENFHPHITLLRVKKIEAEEDLVKFYEELKNKGLQLKGLRFPVREIILFKSELSSKGPTYTPLYKFSLRGEL